MHLLPLWQIFEPLCGGICRRSSIVHVNYSLWVCGVKESDWEGCQADAWAGIADPDRKHTQQESQQWTVGFKGLNTGTDLISLRLILSCWSSSGSTSLKSLRLCRFRQDRDEIWSDFSSSKHASIDGVGFLIRCHTFKIATLTLFCASDILNIHKTAEILFVCLTDAAVVIFNWCQWTLLTS